MDLILWRHAEAVPGPEDDAEADLSRPLTRKGDRQALRMAAWLGRQLPENAKVLASPAVRAQQTAAALERRVKTVAELAPGGSVEALLHAARWPDGRDAVVVVGHQPALGTAAAYLLSGQPQQWPLRKGGLWWLRAREREGTLQVVLHAAVAPDLV